MTGTADSPAKCGIARILLGASDSPAGFAAARLAIDLAVACHATVRAVHVLTDGDLDSALAMASAEARAGGPELLAERRAQDANAMLRHVAILAGRCRVPVQTVQLSGELAGCLLAEAGRWAADLIVLGQGGAGRHGPSLNSDVRRVLEFASQPVLVVPAS
jgi:nucleotide-binding universal stress UspA family protein